MKLKTSAIGAIGAAGALAAAFFGKWSSDLVTLVCFMGVDFLTGIIVAAIFKKSAKSSSGALESRACCKGIVRKCVMLLIVGIAHRLDVSLGTDYIRSAVIIALISNEGISIIENASLMGVPLPKVVKNALDVLCRESVTPSVSGEYTEKRDLTDTEKED